VPAPDSKTILQVLQDVGKTEGAYNNFAFTPEIYNNVADSCGRNLRLALIQLQASRYTKNAEGMLAPHRK
jgi:hypothetical protein